MSRWFLSAIENMPWEGQQGWDLGVIAPFERLLLLNWLEIYVWFQPWVPDIDGFKKPGTNILPLFSLQCDKIQCQSGTTMTAALYGRWVDWPHISVEILPSLVFNECSHVFLQGNKIIRTFQSVNVDPLHVLLVRRLMLFHLSVFTEFCINARVQLNEEKN